MSIIDNAFRVQTVPDRTGTCQFKYPDGLVCGYTVRAFEPLTKLGNEGIQELCGDHRIEESLRVLNEVVTDGKLNVKLLTDVFAYICQHPHDWYQREWRCGAGMCVAGWAVSLSGLSWKNDNPDEGDRGIVVLPNGVEVGAKAAAVAVLGVKPDSYGDVPLFGGSNDLEAVATHIARLITAQGNA